MTFIKADEKIAARSLVAGNPGKIIKQVSDEMIKWKTAGTKLYQSLPKEMQDYWAPCEALSVLPADVPTQEILYKTWKDTKADL